MSLSHRCALSSWLPEPPAHADPSIWVSTVPACSALGTLPWASCSQEDKSAVLGAPGIDLLGSSAPFCSSQLMGFPSFDSLSPMGTVLVTGCSSRAGSGKAFQLTYFPRASLGRASFSDTAKVIHHNQNPAGTRKMGKKEGE